MHHHAIVTENNIIVAIKPAADLATNNNVIDYKNALITPAFIDLQLYGAHKRLLSAYPDAESVKAIYDYSKTGGASHCMPTVGTSTYETIFKCIDAIKYYWNAGGEGVLGLQCGRPVDKRSQTRCP